MTHYWPPFTKNQSYFNINYNILKNVTNKNIEHGFKTDVYDLWFKQLDYHTNCKKENVIRGDIYNENCLKELKTNLNYQKLDKDFLRAYDECYQLKDKFETLNQTSILGSYCLNIVSAARLIEEYKTCCQKPAREPITSTLCKENFNNTFLAKDSFKKLIKLGEQKLNG
jgi:hypothetical protein